MGSKSSSIYRVSFYGQTDVYELYAKALDPDSFYGFIGLSDLVFDAMSGVVVDPAEERLKSGLKG